MGWEGQGVKACGQCGEGHKPKAWNLSGIGIPKLKPGMYKTNPGVPDLFGILE